MAARPHGEAAVGKRREGRRQIERRHEPGARATATARRAARAIRRCRRAAAPAAIRPAAAAASRRGCRTRGAPLAASARPGCSPPAFRGDHSSGPCGAMASRPVERGRRREAALAARPRTRIGLNADPGWRRDAAGAVERPIACSRVRRRAPARRRSADRSRRAPPRGRTFRAARDRPRPRVPPHPADRRRTSCRRASRADGRRRTRRGTAGAGSPSRSRAAPSLALRYGRTRMAARCASCSCAAVMKPASRMRASTTWLRATRAVEVVPRRQRRRRAREPGDERALGERERGCRLVEQPPRHRLDAVDAGAQVDAIEIQLENLRLGELHLDQQRQDRLARLAARSSCGWRETACARAAASACCRPRPCPARRTLRTTARPSAIGIDAGMQVEAVVLDRDEGLLQRRRDRVERHVLPLFVESEPAPAVGRVEPGVADTARQLVNDVRLTRQPDAADRRRRRRRPREGSSRGHDRCEAGRASASGALRQAESTHTN